MMNSLESYNESELLTELESRYQANKNLIKFTDYTFPGYEPASHHHLIAEKLEAVERGELKRLMIFMPPRHGKSELASIRFPAWYLGRNPNRHVIAISYSSDLAEKFGRSVRGIVSNPSYHSTFAVQLAEDSKAAGRWNTKNGGSYIAAGYGGQLTGHGANLLIIDDPIKNREEADSEIVREKVWNWYTSTAYTRLQPPNGAIVLIQTRWHEDDLAGRLLEAQTQGGDQWEVISLKALDNDSALWPERYSSIELEKIRAVIGQRDWSALYQQEPMPETGGYFQKDWFRLYDKLPDNLQYYITSDYAVTANGGDYTVHLVSGIGQNNDIHLVDLWRSQADTNTWINALLGLINRYKPLQLGEENGQIIKSVGPFIDKKMQESGIYCYRQQYPSTSDKATRAQSFRGRASQGKVWIPRTAPWLDDFYKEILSFPVGKHDDIVDACSLVGRMLQEMKSSYEIKQGFYDSSYSVFA